MLEAATEKACLITISSVMGTENCDNGLLSRILTCTQCYIVASIRIVSFAMFFLLCGPVKYDDQPPAHHLAPLF